MQEAFEKMYISSGQRKNLQIQVLLSTSCKEMETYDLELQMGPVGRGGEGESES